MEDRFPSALAANHFATRLELVSGGSQGLADFTDAYQRGQNVIPKDAHVEVA